MHFLRAKISRKYPKAQMPHAGEVSFNQKRYEDHLSQSEIMRFVPDYGIPLAWDYDKTDDGIAGLVVEFPFERQLTEREAKEIVAGAIPMLGWLIPGRTTWSVNTKRLKAWLVERNKGGFFEGLEWMQYDVQVAPELEHWLPDYHEGSILTAQGLTGKYALKFSLLRAQYLSETRTRIFLSHKGVDKPLVRSMYDVLRDIGYQPWIDEHAMVAGDYLHRSISDGFRQSCAAVFFVTPQFVDERFIKQEINYATREKLEREDSFSIITLLYRNDSRQDLVIPDLLRDYVWKEPHDQIEALREIVRALPICLGPPVWRR